jgi:hypothetical protein
VPELRDGFIVPEVAFAQTLEPYPETVAEGLKNENYTACASYFEPIFCQSETARMRGCL